MSVYKMQHSYQTELSNWIYSTTPKPWPNSRHPT